MVTYKDLITKIYKEYLSLEDNYNYADFEKKVALDYESLNKTLFIKELLEQNFSENFVSTVFFDFPKLWCDFTINDWKDIVNNTLRPHVRPLMDNHGCYYDLFFLNKFLHINPFALLEERNKWLITKMLAFNSFFVLNEVDIENLEDGTIPIADLLEETFKKLNVKEELISENRDYEAFYNYLSKLSDSIA